MDQSRGRTRSERGRQEMTNSNPSPSPRLLWCPWPGTWRQMGMEGGRNKAWPARGPTYAQLVLESWLQHTQDLLDVTWTVSSFSYIHVNPMKSAGWIFSRLNKSPDKTIMPTKWPNKYLMHCSTSQKLTQNQKKLFKGYPTTVLNSPYYDKSIKQRRAYLTHNPQRLELLTVANEHEWICVLILG